VIDLNADVGEEDDPGSVDLELLDLVSSASVACGFHAGNRAVMEATVAEASRRGVTVGAHPSYNDREGFGRRPMEVDLVRLTDDIATQIGTLQDIAGSCGASVRYVKAHGALYNRMSVDESVALVVARAVTAFDNLALLVQAQSVAVDAALSTGLEVATEAFADRAYLDDGQLAPRDVKGSVIDDPRQAAEQAVHLATEGRVRTVSGKWLEVRAESICLHGDTPGAAQRAAWVRRALEEAGVQVAAFAR